VGQVAQVVLDLAEGPVLREVDQALGHLAENRLGMGPQAAQEFLETRFTVFRGL
jgi:hypothetical protein